MFVPPELDKFVYLWLDNLVLLYDEKELQLFDCGIWKCAAVVK